MSSYLSVQLAARRLGVSPVTIRRWTATGFLPCTRTAGGHRRIAVDDIDELARTIGGSSHLAAKRARERELDNLVETSIAVASQTDLQPLLAEIARRLTRLLDCDFCAVSEYDPARQTVRTLAEYDATGKRLPDPGVYHVREFPQTRRVLDEQTPAVVNVDDPRADAAEVAQLRRDGDRSLLILPLVYRGTSIGLIEVIDASRARRYTRQELRLGEAVAGQAAVALRNARLLADSGRGEDALARLREALAALAPATAEAVAEADAGAVLERLARAVCAALPAASCVASGAGHTAGATSADAGGRGGDTTEGATGEGHIVVAGRPDGVTLTVALRSSGVEGAQELLDLLAGVTGAALARRASAPA